jgi:hypothetical protein
MSIIPQDGQSPFDKIRRTRPDGSEYWSARDLMPLMGYGADWRNLITAIDRAEMAAENIGEDIGHLFGDVTEKSGGRPRQDFHLTRYAAYLVAMNGDPRKPETASAQAYFAVRTREAETALPDLSTIDGQLAVAQQLVAQTLARKEAEERALKSEGTVKAIEAANGITLREFHKQYFPEVPERAFFQKLYDLGILIDQRGSRGRDDRTGRIKNGYQHRHPGYKGKPYIYLHGSLDPKGVRRESPKVRPGQPEIDLARLLNTKGLSLNPTITLPKEIAA